MNVSKVYGTGIAFHEHYILTTGDVARHAKKLAAIDKTRCVACGVCENTCPLGAVKVRRGCYAAVEAERCVGCGKCAKICPVGCIEVKVRADA